MAPNLSFAGAASSSSSSLIPILAAGFTGWEEKKLLGPASAENLRVDGDPDNIIFEFVVGSGETVMVGGITFFGDDDAALDALALTKGILLEVQSNGSRFVLATIKTYADLVKFFNESLIVVEQGADDPVIGTHRFSPAPITLGVAGDFIRAVVQDDLTALAGLTSLSISLHTWKQASAGAAASGTGYFAGGNNGGTIFATTDGLVFATDTVAMAAKGTLAAARTQLAAVNSTTNGYFVAGSNPAATALTNISKLIFATDTVGQANLAAVVSVARRQHSATPSSTKGYYAGGAGPLSSAEALVFSSETVETGKGVLTSARELTAAASSATVGYFAGGAADVTTCDGLVFATDTVAMAAKGTLSTGRSGSAGHNSSTRAYYTGGVSGGAALSSTSSLLFSTDTVAQTLKGNLVTARLVAGACNSNLKGYVSGGLNSVSAPISTTEALDYLSDTVTMLSRPALSSVKESLSACQSGGWL